MLLRLVRPALGPILLLSAAFPALCQDLVAVAPQAAKVEYEDAQIRVVRLKMAPNASLEMHDRPARVVIPLTPTVVRIARPDGTTSMVRSAAGYAAWSEPARRSVTNLGGPLENVVVEFKKVVDSAIPRAHPPTPRPAGYLEERFHRWLFENQYVRVYDVRIPAGQTTDFHLHALDAVWVELSAGLTASQTQGQAWEQAENNEAGRAGFSPDAKKPRTHRVRNDGQAEYHVVLIQFLQ